MECLNKHESCETPLLVAYSCTDGQYNAQENPFKPDIYTDSFIIDEGPLVCFELLLFVDAAAPDGQWRNEEMEDEIQLHEHGTIDLDEHHESTLMKWSVHSNARLLIYMHQDPCHTTGSLINNIIGHLAP